MMKKKVYGDNFEAKTLEIKILWVVKGGVLVEKLSLCSWWTENTKKCERNTEFGERKKWKSE